MCFGRYADLLDRVTGIHEVTEINLTPSVLRKGILKKVKDKDKE